MSRRELAINVRRAYNNFFIDASITIPATECIALFGPSGSGKTSLLRLVAGLDRPDSGAVILNGKAYSNTDGRLFVPPEKRRIGYVFQDAQLFPHLTVRQNLQYAQKRAPQATEIIDADSVISGLSIDQILDRWPEKLSGGETQRVALARALLSQPQLILLDEPLNGLDHLRKSEALDLLKSINADNGIPIIFVSHNIDEIDALAGTVAQIEDGRIVEHGAVADVLPSIVSRQSQAYLPYRLLKGTVAEHDTSLYLTRVTIGKTKFSVPLNTSKQIGEPTLLVVRALDVSIAMKPPVHSSIRNRITGEILSIFDQISGPYSFIRLSTEGGELTAQITREARTTLNLTEGDTVVALVKSASFSHTTV